tara:strand:- start:187 stop:747 length:561 start_codon:yes stop_codon:yes gene_type:complete
MNDYPWKLLPCWLNKSEAEVWKKKLFDNLEWDQPKVNVFGKDYLVPRKTMFIGDKDILYRYSGVTHKGKGWPQWIHPLLEQVCFISKSNFNGCLVNLYRNGLDRMGWHSDNEKELRSDKPIASLSLGASRDFFIKHRDLPKKAIIKLNNGDLLIMHPLCQKEWIHSIPIRKKILDYRINLTFRCYK